MSHPLEDPLYYLDNFRTLTQWVAQRYDDLLDARERALLHQIHALPECAAALLARLVMRKGSLFRRSSLGYAEIEALDNGAAALSLLSDAGLIDLSPQLPLEALFSLLKKAELAQIFGPSAKSLRKQQWYEALAAQDWPLRTLHEWAPKLDDCGIELLFADVYERLRLMFFGNLRQDFSDFVLADLGIFCFEQVTFDAQSRGFHCRQDIDDYLRIHHQREALERHGGAALDSEEGLVLIAYQCANPWIEQRRQRWLLKAADSLRKEGKSERSLSLYSLCLEAGARVKQVRLLEKVGRLEQAWEIASDALQAPRDSEEEQHMGRILPRLERKLGKPKTASPAAAPTEHFYLQVERASSVEMAAADAIGSEQSPVFYVENALINALFGLLCWEAIFAPLSGAFFHPFHRGPADLLRSDFVERRREVFERCLGYFDDGSYQQRIVECFRRKQGIQSPFVAWGWIDEPLITLALRCIPAQHLRYWCEWLMRDIKRNRAGFADLIQFYPEQQRYRMIEVKGPGDRLQDNQKRMIAFCHAHDLPIAVCWVSWCEALG
ncbi:Fanconi-associated nuclease 1 [Carnimonas sp. R-84981]|uniref:VRR-NUC domain-containing protein n=1 Tax=Carnimonas bestiolae TaxID=3402172 RepID=UPI003EDBFA18